MWENSCENMFKMECKGKVCQALLCANMCFVSFHSEGAHYCLIRVPSERERS